MYPKGWLKSSMDFSGLIPENHVVSEMVDQLDDQLFDECTKKADALQLF